MDEKILKKIEYLLVLADRFLASEKPIILEIGLSTVPAKKYDNELYAEFRSSTKSLIIWLYGKEHPYYFDLEGHLRNLNGIKEAKGILKAIKKEIQDGFILKLKDLVSREVFSDFIEMAEYLLNEGYKDPSAVIIGSVLERRLRELMTRNKLDIYSENGFPKKASRLNDELHKAEIYGKLDHKNISAHLCLRNDVAHGEYKNYSKQQVEIMLAFVRDFSNRI